jgi:hypothetical protein
MYYHRDNDGNWFVKHGDNLTPVEDSSSMELAYIMGKLAAWEDAKKLMFPDVKLASPQGKGSQ